MTDDAYASAEAKLKPHHKLFEKKWGTDYKTSAAYANAVSGIASGRAVSNIIADLNDPV